MHETRRRYLDGCRRQGLRGNREPVRYPITNPACSALKRAYGCKKNGIRGETTNRLWAAAATFLLSAAINGAQAQDYPARTVTVIVPFAAGGPTDITGRIVADIFSRRLGQKFVVENVGGAGGTIGALRAARAPADGYTILSGHVGTNALAAAFYPNLGYNPLRDFEPIGISAEYPELLAVRKDFPANTLKEFVAYARANEAKLNVGRAGLGSVSYIGCLLLNNAIGIKPAMVPFTGTAPVLNAMLGGEIDYERDPVLGTLEHVRAGTVRRWPSPRANAVHCCLMCRRPTSRACRNSTARRSMRCSRLQARRKRSWRSSRRPSTSSSTRRRCKNGWLNSAPTLSNRTAADRKTVRAPCSMISAGERHLAASAAFTVRPQCRQPFAISRIAQVDAELPLDRIVPDPFRFGIEASRHRRKLRRFERDFRRRLDAAQPRGKRDDVLGRRWLVVGDIVDAAPPRPGQRRFDHGGDVGDVNPVEDLAGLDDAARRSCSKLHERVSAGTVDPRQPENLHGDAAARTEGEPCLLGCGPDPGTPVRGGGRRRFIDPAAAMVAIDADRGEIASAISSS